MTTTPGGPADPYRAPESATDVSSSDDLYDSYVGPRNTAWYASRFEQFRSGGSAVGWHWPAFFVTGLWLLYRKMWLLALGYWIGLPILVGIISGLLATIINPDLAGAVINLGYLAFIFVAVPMFATHTYYRHAQGKVEKVSRAFASDAERAAELSRIGGTSNIIVILIPVIIALVGILAAITIPAYQDYTIRAQVSEGLSLSAVPKAAVSEYYDQRGTMPADNADAMLPPPGDIAGRYVASVAVDDGVIVVTYGGEAHDLIAGQVLELSPKEAPGDMLTWSCNGRGLAAKYLPAACR